MRRPLFAVVFSFLVLVVVFVALLQSMCIVERLAVVDRLEGQVEVQRAGAGRWVPLRKGMPVKTLDVVHTRDKSKVELKWADGTRMKLGPGSIMEIRKCTFNTSSKVETSLFRLDLGRVWVRIMRSLDTDDRFQVAAPAAVAAVRGTIFSVAVEPSGATSVEVYDGTVALETRQARTTLSAGAAASLRLPSEAPSSRTLSAQELSQWKGQERIVTPALEVSSPAENSKVSAPVVEVQGVVEPTCQLQVNGQPTKPNSKGAFEAAVTLKPGQDTILVTARDRRGVATTVTRHVRQGEMD